MGPEPIKEGLPDQLRRLGSRPRREALVSCLAIPPRRPRCRCRHFPGEGKPEGGDRVVRVTVPDGKLLRVLRIREGSNDPAHGPPLELHDGIERLLHSAPPSAGVDHGGARPTGTDDRTETPLPARSSNSSTRGGAARYFSRSARKRRTCPCRSCSSNASRSRYSS